MVAYIVLQVVTSPAKPLAIIVSHIIPPAAQLVDLIVELLMLHLVHTLANARKFKKLFAETHKLMFVELMVAPIAHAVLYAHSITTTFATANLL